MKALNGRRLAAILVVLLGIAAARDLGRLGAAAPWRTMDDFADFYCAGFAVTQRGSPYVYEPLHDCEHRVNAGATFRGRLFAQNAGIAIPAPQPPYDFAPFALAARLPFAQARALDAGAILLAVALTAGALAGLGLPMGLCLAALALSTGYMELNTGQIVPFALCALAFCGLALARGRDPVAGVLAALTAIEPVAGVPVILATLLFVPRARLATLLSLGALALLGIAMVGTQGILTYVLAVLPAHAASEVHFPFQYSLTSAVAALGLPAGLARTAGAISYVAMLVLGLMLAPRVATAFARRELLVFLPALCAVVGGTFLHAEELCFAIPAMLVLAVAARNVPRTFAALAVCALAIPWILVWGEKQLFLASLFVCAAILFSLQVPPRVALPFLFATAAVIYAFELHPPHLPVPQPMPVAAANALVQGVWQRYTESRSTRDPLWLAIKLPTWIALLAALGVAVHYGLRSRPASEAIRGS